MTPTTRPLSSTISAVARVSACTAAPASSAAATSFSITSQPPKASVAQRWPRGAGRAISLYGQAFSPSHISPSLVVGIQVGADHRVGSKVSPRSTNHWKCAALPSQYRRSFSWSACGPSAASR